MAEKPSVLVLCSKNSCRSQMAEGFLRKYLGDQFQVYSAGLKETEVHPLAIKVMGDIGIDISEQYAKNLKEYLGKMSFRYVIFVCEKAEQDCPYTFPFTIERMKWPFDDPAIFRGTDEEKYAEFCRVRDEIKLSVLNWQSELEAE